MESQIFTRTTNKKSFKKCAVFKIDLGGRIVNVDDLTEQLLGLQSEVLFGRNISEFLDAASYNAVLQVLNYGKRYETFYETTELVFIDSRKNHRELPATISLNFIGGNPANYQIIINPYYERILAHIEQPNGSEKLSRLLFNYVANLSERVDWEKLSKIFLDIDKIILFAIYYRTDETLKLITSASDSTERETDTNLSAIDERHLRVAASRQPLINYPIVNSANSNDDENAELAESSYPLVYGGLCWGIIRLLHEGDINNMDIEPETMSNFLGNALFSFISGDIQNEL